MSRETKPGTRAGEVSAATALELADLPAAVKRGMNTVVVTGGVASVVDLERRGTRRRATRSDEPGRRKRTERRGR